MSEEEINIVIAEEHGWKFVLDYWNAPNRSCLRIVRKCSDGDEKTYPPYYFKDLNAMHEVEELLDDDQWLEYMLNLQDVLQRDPYRGKWIVCQDNMHSTAAQRAKAFVKTINKWKE